MGEPDATRPLRSGHLVEFLVEGCVHPALRNTRQCGAVRHPADSGIPRIAVSDLPPLLFRGEGRRKLTRELRLVGVRALPRPFGRGSVLARRVWACRPQTTLATAGSRSQYVCSCCSIGPKAQTGEICARTEVHRSSRHSVPPLRNRTTPVWEGISAGEVQSSEKLALGDPAYVVCSRHPPHVLSACLISAS